MSPSGEEFAPPQREAARIHDGDSVSSEDARWGDQLASVDGWSSGAHG